ncbi:MAG: ferredoxin [Actinobacteria bacterium]|nr:ferredoxin [Actinomycetota bacterium]MBV8960323.1 ferredoxin [Actinomycetota bacterium]MBV9252941.1 ferredoxin [Actinomycetota bacterium]MBV9663187.1 ferredoxin [Actinomycetota bacterium]
MRLTIDVERCQGHGRCYDLAPELFAPDDAGHAVLVDPDGTVGADDEARARDAVRNCPEGALSVGT